MGWISLESLGQLDEIKNQQGFTIIFKHSTRCSISMMVKKRFELDWDKLPDDLNIYFLDLIQNREISNAIASNFLVPHESPQLLLIENGECVLDLSHGEVSVDEVMSVLT
jgi:bacillithiol system protein YtxJ